MLMALHIRPVATVMPWNNKPKDTIIRSQSCATFLSAMPFFTNKFSPKKIPTRKADVSLANKDLSPKRIERELGPDIGPIKLRLGEQEATFDEGLWIPETGKASGTFRENEKLRKEVKKLEEENNLLKLKFELLLDMLTETTAEVHMHRGELESLRNKLSYGKRTAT